MYKSLANKNQTKSSRSLDMRMDDIILSKSQYDMLYGESGRNGISILSRRQGDYKLKELHKATLYN